MFFISRFKNEEKLEISNAIKHAESGTSGEIRVHLSYAWREPDLLRSAIQKFAELKMDQTKHRNGILLYINPRQKKFALYGDEEIHKLVQQDFWEKLAKNISTAIQEKNPVHGIVLAVHALGVALKEHYPHEDSDQNELGNEVTE